MSDSSERDPGQVVHRDWVQQQGFTQVENVVLRDANLSMGARLLYALLKMHAWQKDSAFPGQERLGELMGVKVRMVQIYLKELADAGLIARKQRGGTKSNVYYIQPLNAIYCAGDTQSITGHKAQDITGHDTQSITPEEDSVKNTQKKKTQVSSVATPQAPQPLARGKGAKRDMGRDIPLVAPDYDYKALWAAIEQHTERKLLWNYAIETQAVKRIVKAYPAATPEELIGFLAYLETVFPWSQDPTKQVTFSEGAKHFARWYSDGQPTTVTQKGRITHVRTYDDPDAINAEIQALAAAERAAERDVPGYRAEPVPLRRRA